MNAFDFHAPSRVVFGWGRVIEIGAVARSVGRRVFLVWGTRTIASSQAGREIVRAIEAEGIAVHPLQLPPGEPEVATIDGLAAELRSLSPTRGDVVVAVGGGSGMDAGKALAALALDPERASIKDFLEGVGVGRKIAWPVLPVVAVPTTAGTGSEATFNAVISSRDPPFKKSFRDHRLMPKVALIDPQLACSAPKHITAWAGMDALTQLIEAYISKKATDESRLYAGRGMFNVGRALRKSAEMPTLQSARERVAYAAYCSGLALANSGLGLAHGVAAGLGSLKGTAHGLACAVMLSAAIETNKDVAFDDGILRWQELVLTRVTGKHRPIHRDWDVHAELLDEVRSLQKDLEIPTRLRDLGVTKEDIPELVRLSQGSSLSGNPKPITEAELATLLESML